MKPPESSLSLFSYSAIQRHHHLRRITWSAAVAAFAFLCLPCSRGNTDDESLEFLIKKSSVVIDGEISTISTGTVFETGVVEWPINLRNVTLLAGTPLPSEKNILVVRFANTLAPTEKDIPPYFKTGEHCIFFLKPNPDKIPPYRITDMWFGIQPYTEAMAKRIRALSKPDLASPAAIRRATGAKPPIEIPRGGMNQ